MLAIIRNSSWKCYMAVSRNASGACWQWPETSRGMLAVTKKKQVHTDSLLFHTVLECTYTVDGDHQKQNHHRPHLHTDPWRFPLDFQYKN
jgi:hypothetical protein